MVAGNGRCCSAIIRETGGEILVKTGAEGVFGGCVPSRGIGFVLKADDGSTRGSEVMLGGLLNKLGLLDEATRGALGQWFNPQIVNSQKHRTGEVIASKYWSS